MKVLALAAIRFYQRNISPRKGFCCAYARYTGGASCSALGYRAIRRFGVLEGLGVLDRRLERCGTAHRIALHSAQLPLQRQQGFLDCGGCDVGACDGIGWDNPFSGSLGRSCWSPLDACSGCSCDWPNRRSSAKRFDNTRLDNEDAIKRRSRILRERPDRTTGRINRDL